jgi:tetratricopeptide (TPR) repeat protein
MLKTTENTLIDNCLDKYNLALEYQSNGKYAEAIELLDEAIADVRKPQNLLNEVHLIAILQDALATVYMETDERKKALYFFEKSVLNIDMLLEHERQDSIQHQENQALKLVDMSALYRSLQEYDKAIESSQKAIAYYETLLTTNSNYQEDNIYVIKGEISMINAEVADMIEMDREKAIGHIQKAIEFYDLALSIKPDVIAYQIEKALTQILLADNYSLNYDTTSEALSLLKKAIKSFEILLKELPNDEQLRISAANSKAHLGRIYRELGEIYVALEYFEQAIEDYTLYLQDVPLDYEALDHIGVNLNNMANIYISTQQKNQVSSLLNQAIEHYNTVLRESKKGEDSHYDEIIVKEVLYHKAIAQIDLSRFHIELGELEEAKKIIKTSIADSNVAIEQNTSDINFLNQKALAITVQADIDDIESNHTKAIEGYQDAISIFDASLHIKPNDLFTINHRGLAKGDIVTSCITLDKKEEGDFWFEEAMKDYEHGIKLSPTFTDMVINRATLLSDWAYANKHSVAQEELLELLQSSMTELDAILEKNPYHFSAMNNKLTISSDIAGIYKEQGKTQKVLEIYYEEVENYTKFLEIYNNDLMSFMNAGVSKLLLSKELIELQRPVEALSFLKSSLSDYATVLKSDPNDMETLSNQSLSMREIIDIETSSEHLQESIELNHKMLELYDNYFTGVEKEKDSHTLTYNMTFPLSSLIYAYYRSKNLDVNSIVNALEMTKAKTLKMLMSETVEENNLNPNDKDRFIELQNKQKILHKELKALKIRVKEHKEAYSEMQTRKSVPQVELKSIQKVLNKSLTEREKLYEELHHYRKEISKLLHLNEDTFDPKTIENIDEKSVIIYPIYDADRSELQVVALYKEKDEVKITIEHKVLEDNPKFYNFILLIKDVEEFFGLEEEEEKKKKIKALNSKYGKMSKKVLESLFELDKNLKILKLKIDHSELMNNSRYKILNLALDYVSETIVKAIPKEKTKIYFSPFGDLNMLPLHAIEINEDNYLIDNYEIVYIPSLAIWANKINLNLRESEASALKNLYVSQDHLNQTICYDEVIACQKILEGEHLNSPDTLSFKKVIDNQSFNTLHLSVHGIADLKNPLNSGLIFNKSQLSILEIQALKFQANLVVLSACESNLAKAEGADEMLAFERAFMVAGAENIISTFDAVDAKQITFFMQYFYEEVQNGVSLSKAFQKSLLERIGNESNEWMLFRFMGV